MCLKISTKSHLTGSWSQINSIINPAIGMPLQIVLKSQTIAINNCLEVFGEKDFS